MYENAEGVTLMVHKISLPQITISPSSLLWLTSGSPSLSLTIALQSLQFLLTLGL